MGRIYFILLGFYYSNHFPCILFYWRWFQGDRGGRDRNWFLGRKNEETTKYRIPRTADWIVRRLSLSRESPYLLSSFSDSFTQMKYETWRNNLYKNSSLLFPKYICFIYIGRGTGFLFIVTAVTNTTTTLFNSSEQRYCGQIASTSCAFNPWISPAACYSQQP